MHYTSFDDDKQPIFREEILPFDEDDDYITKGTYKRFIPLRLSEDIDNSEQEIEPLSKWYSTAISLVSITSGIYLNTNLFLYIKL